jgi:cytochrome c oxidase assembly factor CtaG
MSHPQAGGPAALSSTVAGAPDPGAALAWSLAPESILPLAALTALYAVGWCRLARRCPQARPAAWRLAAGAAGLLTLAAALLTPVATLGHFLFAAHMTQHMLLMAVAAPLLLLADPFPAVLWALPRPLRIGLGRRLTGGSRLRAGWERLTSVPAAALVYAAVLWAWHHPWAYEAALAREWVHHLEHLTFFGAAVVFWWSVIGPAPRARRPASHGLRIGHVVTAALHGSVLAMLLAWSPRVLYETYAAAPRVTALMPQEDQALGGVIMWAGASTVDMLAVLALVWRFLAALERPAAATSVELGVK